MRIQSLPAHTVRPDSAADRGEMGSSVCAEQFCMRGGAGAGGALGGGGPGQRMNAAATPESTGISSPVVIGRVPLVNASTAIAMCSGSTSSFSTVRWA